MGEIEVIFCFVFDYVKVVYVIEFKLVIFVFKSVIVNFVV